MADTTDEIKQPNMEYINMLKESANKTGSIACMGLDPIADAIPIDGPFRKKVVDFHEKIFNRMLSEGVLPGAFKPNYGFFEVHDNQETGYFEGTNALSDLIFLAREKFPGIPVTLDFKRGDIAASSLNYAKVGANNWKIDAMTVAPYMGTDSVMPFIETGKGIYILDRTSNSGGADFQNLRTIKDGSSFRRGLYELMRQSRDMNDAGLQAFLNDKVNKLIAEQAPYLYEVVADKIVDWSKDYKGVGAVFGATNPDELRYKAPFFAKNEMMLLIPGVGKQGGSASQIVDILNAADYPMYLARINNSSGLTHPWKTADKAPKEWDVEVVENLRKLNDEINYKPNLN